MAPAEHSTPEAQCTNTNNTLPNGYGEEHKDNKNSFNDKDQISKAILKTNSIKEKQKTLQNIDQAIHAVQSELECIERGENLLNSSVLLSFFDVSLFTESELASSNQREVEDELLKEEEKLLDMREQLQKEGYWIDSPPIYRLEPPRNKTHWDYLLDEMKYNSEEIRKERTWRRHAASYIANSVTLNNIDKSSFSNNKSNIDKEQNNVVPMDVDQDTTNTDSSNFRKEELDWEREKTLSFMNLGEDLFFNVENYQELLQSFVVVLSGKDKKLFESVMRSVEQEKQRVKKSKTKNKLKKRRKKRSQTLIVDDSAAEVSDSISSKSRKKKGKKRKLKDIETEESPDKIKRANKRMRTNNIRGEDGTDLSDASNTSIVGKIPKKKTKRRKKKLDKRKGKQQSTEKASGEAAWSSIEDEALLQVSKIVRSKNWDAICDILNFEFFPAPTPRSPDQCKRRYQILQNQGNTSNVGNDTEQRLAKLAQDACRKHLTIITNIWQRKPQPRGRQAKSKKGSSKGFPKSDVQDVEDPAQIAQQMKQKFPDNVIPGLIRTQRVFGGANGGSYPQQLPQHHQQLSPFHQGLQSPNSVVLNSAASRGQSNAIAQINQRMSTQKTRMPMFGPGGNIDPMLLRQMQQAMTYSGNKRSTQMNSAIQQQINQVNSRAAAANSGMFGTTGMPNHQMVANMMAAGSGQGFSQQPNQQQYRFPQQQQQQRQRQQQQQYSSRNATTPSNSTASHPTPNAMSATPPVPGSAANSISNMNFGALGNMNMNMNASMMSSSPHLSELFARSDLTPQQRNDILMQMRASAAASQSQGQNKGQSGMRIPPSPSLSPSPSPSMGNRGGNTAGSSMNNNNTNNNNININTNNNTNNTNNNNEGAGSNSSQQHNGKLQGNGYV